MSLRSEYDQWHERVNQSDLEHDDALTPWYELVRSTIGPIAGLEILEVACGRGGFVRELSLAGARITGCDFSLTALRIGRSKLNHAASIKSKAWLVQGDAQKLPFANASFDVIVSCETIEHLPEVQAALREMHRVTRPGGRLFLTTPNYLNLMGLYELYALIRHPGRRDDQPFDRRQYFLQVRRYVQKAGWRICYSDGTVHQLPVLPGRNPVVLPQLEANHSLRRLLSPFAYHYFVIGKREES